MKELKAIELRDKSIPELEQMALQIKSDLFRARRDLVFRQNTDTTGLKTRRHNMARILTVISEKKRGGE